jgi:hypothetical protein
MSIWLLPYEINFAIIATKNLVNRTGIEAASALYTVQRLPENRIIPHPVPAIIKEYDMEFV